jgi:hypothetical protein
MAVAARANSPGITAHFLLFVIGTHDLSRVRKAPVCPAAQRGFSRAKCGPHRGWAQVPYLRDVT